MPSVPGSSPFHALEGMRALAAVAEAIAVVAAGHDVQQPARAARVGIVIHHEQPAKRVEAVMEGVPEARRHAHQLAAIGPTAKMLPPSPPPSSVVPSRADQLVRGAQVLAHAEDQVAHAVEGEAAQAVVRIVAGRLQLDAATLALELAVLVAPAERSRSASPDTPMPSWPRASAHRVLEAVGEGRRPVRALPVSSKSEKMRMRSLSWPL